MSAGAGLLDELRTAVRDYVVMPSSTALDAVVLWIAATHAVDCWQHATRLVIGSPEKRCGKTRLLDVIEATAHEPLTTANATTAAIYRSLGGDRPPTLLFDEADAIFGTKVKAEQNEDLRGLLNAGFGRGRPALRTVGPTHEVHRFETFCMVALAGIGSLPDTIEDRAVVITMRRRGAGESVIPYRQRRDRPRLEALQARLTAWVATVAGELTDAEPEMPVEDRAADVWEPLVAVADAAGGRWPQAARTAALVLTGAAQEADGERSLGTKLLADVRDIFDGVDVPFMTSAALTDQLRSLEDSPWKDFDLSTRRLAHRLEPYGIRPGHDTTKTSRGYRRESFADAWSRYLPATRPEPSERPKPPETLDLAPDGSQTPDASKRPGPPDSSSATAATPLRVVADPLDCLPPGECRRASAFGSPPCPRHRQAVPA